MKTPTFKTLAITAIAGLTLAACATATPYQPAGYNGQRGGYAEQRLENDRYRVTFSGNSLTSREQVSPAQRAVVGEGHPSCRAAWQRTNQGPTSSTTSSEGSVSRARQGVCASRERRSP